MAAPMRFVPRLLHASGPVADRAGVARRAVGRRYFGLLCSIRGSWASSSVSSTPRPSWRTSAAGRDVRCALGAQAFRPPAGRTHRCHRECSFRPARAAFRGPGLQAYRYLRGGNSSATSAGRTTKADLARLNAKRSNDRRKIIILGGGPNRIGQGIEFDRWRCACRVGKLKDAGFETIMVNCKPETVSTDYDTRATGSISNH